MRVLTLLYYYEPYTSGLTIFAARIANGLARRGHDIRVLTARYEKSLPANETTASGVRISRVPVALNFDRAVILPSFIPQAISAMREVEVVHIHMPMAEAAVLAGIARAVGKRVVVNHHSDLVLEGPMLVRFAAAVSRWSGIGAGKIAHAFVTLTEARANVSPTARHIRKNRHVIPPPIEAEPAPAGSREAFRQERGWGDRPVIGFVGRYTHEKGIDKLLSTIARVREAFPNVLYALVGPTHDPRTGERYTGPWDVLIERYPETVEQLDYLSDEDLARFYTAIDLHVLPSVDWTETFGMVQVEAMLRGAPLVTSNMPGVSDPILRTGSGELVEPGNIDDLAEKLITVLRHRDRYLPDIDKVREAWSLERVLDQYERLYTEQPQ